MYYQLHIVRTYMYVLISVIKIMFYYEHYTNRGLWIEPRTEP